MPEKDRGRKISCLSPTSVIQVFFLIKVCLPAGLRTQTDTLHRQRGFSTYAELSSHSVSVWTAGSLCLSPCTLPSCLESDRLCFQPMFERRPINAGQRERAEVRGGEGATQLVIDREFRVWKAGGDGLVKSREKRTVRRTNDECSSCALLSTTLICVNFHCYSCYSCLCLAVRVHSCWIINP